MINAKDYLHQRRLGEMTLSKKENFMEKGYSQI